MTRIKQTEDGRFSYTYSMLKDDGEFVDIIETGPIEDIIKLKKRLEQT